MMSLYVISKDAWKRYSAEGSWCHEIFSPSFKYNMTDIAAALGFVQLAKCDRMLEFRRRIAEITTRLFKRCEEWSRRPFAPRPIMRGIYIRYGWALEQLRISGSEFIAMMRERNIGTSVHSMPLHLHPYYRNTYE
jgi:dTDP-4-amino-4,6-dideoxygalactose transaminase